MSGRQIDRLLRHLAWLALPLAGLGAAQPADDAAVEPGSLAALDALHVSDIVVEGSSVFSRAELDALTAPYEGRTVSFEDLQELRHDLSRRYVERGYVSSGVVIPDQSVTNGVVVLQAIEGTLTDVVIEGNRRWRDGSLARRVERSVDAPLNVVDLQAGLSRLQRDPSIERLNAELQPGAAPGESYLRIGVAERRPFELTVQAGNDRSAAVGEDRATIGFAYRGLIGNGDALSARVGTTEGAADNLLAYRVPLTARGLALELSLAEQDADIVEEPFAAVDIESRIETRSLTVERPWVDAADRAVTGFVSLEHRRSESTLLDLPFSFSAGDVDGKARGSSLAVGVEWSRRATAHAWATRALVQTGLDTFDATRNAAAPDSEFKLLVAQAEYARRIGWRHGQLFARGVLQLSDEPLLAMYKLPIGGRYSVRGYRESQLVRDNGLAASIEVRFAAFLDDSGQRLGKLDLALFADYGLAEDKDDSLFTAGRERLASVGVGLVWQPLPALTAEIYRGADLDDRHNPRDSLQDRGIHYGLVYRRLF
jgi:hemolysin activation/secretion protein